MLDIMLSSVKVLLRKKTRSLLTLLGILVGVASVIIINNISRCGHQALTGEIDELGMGGLSVMLKNQNAVLADRQLEAIRQLPCVESAMPLMFESTDAYIHEEKTSVYLWGIDKTAKETVNLQLVHGRFLNNGDIASRDKVCMIDQKLARQCYGTEYVAGKRVRINSDGVSEEYRIAGVVQTGSGLLENMMGSYIPSFMYVPYTTLQEKLNTGNYSQIAVRIRPQYDHDESGESIIHTLERDAGTPGAYMVTNLSKQKENIGNILDIFTLVLTCVGVVSLFVAGLSIMNVMLVSVTERTREIGIKKALGASRAMLVFEFLFEALLITLTGALGGVLFGTVVSVIGAALLGLTLTPELDIIIKVVLFSLAVGTVFGIYPAVKAARMNPVEALRAF